jgi:hypothetical protein
MLVFDAPHRVWVYEICDTKYERAQFISESKLDAYNVANRKADQHHSIVAHDVVWAKFAKEKQKVGGVRDTKVKVNHVYLELDRKGEKDPIQKAYIDTLFFITTSPAGDYCVPYFSGNKSTHIAVNATLFGNPIGSQQTICGRGKLIYNLQHKLIGDIRFGNGIVDVWTTSDEVILAEHERIYGCVLDDISTMRQRLENLDPSLCSVNSLIRAPYSKHEKGKHHKLPLSLDDLFAGDIGTLIEPTVKKAKPYLLHWYYECIKPTVKQKKLETIENTDYITQVFLDTIEGFDPADATQDGFVNGLYSPFYDDDNPSVGVNIETGFYKDFGNPEHTFNFIEYLCKIYDITETEAKERIK